MANNSHEYSQEKIMKISGKSCGLQTTGGIIARYVSVTALWTGDAWEQGGNGLVVGTVQVHAVRIPFVGCHE